MSTRAFLLPKKLAGRAGAMRASSTLMNIRPVTMPFSTISSADTMRKLYLPQFVRTLSSTANSDGIETISTTTPTTVDTTSTATTTKAANKNATSATTNKVSDLSMLEIRVGKIVEIAKHPEADSLFVEKVDVGELTGPRTIVSGLVAFCKEEELLNRKVIVLCNLKPRPLKGITSHGMLLCASNTDHTAVVPIAPHPETPVGELITFEGHPSAFVEPGNKASKAFSKVADELFVDDRGVATFKSIPFMTTLGPITSSLKGKIS